MMRALARALLIGPWRWAVHAILLLVLVWFFLPWPLTLAWLDPGTTALMRSRIREARARGEALELRHAPVPLSELSPALVQAVITAEDGRFRLHAGIDWEALGEELHYDGEPPFSITDPDDLGAVARAVRYGLTHRSEIRGRSTITQQLAKNLYFTPQRSLLRKVGELFVAQRLEWVLSKDRILELYLNHVEFGPGIFGAEAAARAYWGVAASELSRVQAASLAATLPHPLVSNPDQNPGRMLWRRDLILRYMEGGRGRTVPPPPPEVTMPSIDPDTTPPDTAPPDTTPPDTVSPDTLLPDTVLPDTAGGPSS